MTYLALKLIVLNIAGWVQQHWRIVAGAFLIVFVVAFVFRQCDRPPKVKLDEKALQEVHDAIESKERKKMEEVFVKVEAKQAEIESNVSDAKANTVNAVADAKKKVSEMTDEELAAELERLADQ